MVGGLVKLQFLYEVIGLKRLSGIKLNSEWKSTALFIQRPLDMSAFYNFFQQASAVKVYLSH
jgi:hypothetical protein